MKTPQKNTDNAQSISAEESLPGESLLNFGSNQERLDKLGLCGHTVEDGDTLWGIAETFTGDGMNLGDLYTANEDTIGKDPDLILPGQILDICDQTLLTGEALPEQLEASAEEQDPTDFIGVSQQLFPTLDSDADGFLSEADLDAAMLSPDLTTDQAAALITLRKFRSDLEELSNDEFLDENSGITLADLQAYQTTGAISAELRERIEAQYTYRQDRISGASTDLFANGLPDINAMQQGSIGDCYFLAALGSAVSQDPQAVADMIVPQEDGTYTVTFPNGQSTTVAAPTLAEIGTYGTSGADGMWVTLLERAAGQLADPDAGIAPEGLDGGSLLSRWGAQLFSRDGTANFDTNTFTSDEVIANRIEAALDEGRTVVGHINGDLFQDRREGLPNGHAYSIIDFDRESGTITLRNPWGRQEHEDADGRVIDGVNDGTFTLTLEEYNRLFTGTAYSNGTFAGDE